MEYIFKRMVDGFLYGMGMTVCMLVWWIIAAMLVYAASGGNLENLNLGESSFSDTEGTGAVALLSITDHYVRENDTGVFAVLGQIMNDGEDAVDYIDIEVEIFDENNQFRGEYTTFIEHGIKPGETENFEIPLFDCCDRKTPEYTTYTIRVTGAEYE